MVCLENIICSNWWKKLYEYISMQEYILRCVDSAYSQSPGFKNFFDNLMYQFETCIYWLRNFRLQKCWSANFPIHLTLALITANW